MAPIVFVSHASDDKERFVLDFAEMLRKNGVDAWVDKWEMNPGDKLIEKIFDHGIANAKAFIAVISKISINKPWVREELDAALVRRIEGNTKLIPVVIDDCEVPLVLRSTIWVKIKDLSNYDKEFQQILAAIFDHSEKPPIGPAPSYVAVASTTIGNLSLTESLVFKTMFEAILASNRRLIQISELENRLEALGVNKSIVQECLAILTVDKLIETKRLENGYIFSIKPTTKGFEQYADAYLPEYKNARIDVAAMLINSGRGVSHEIAQALDISPIIVHYIMEEFAEKKLLLLKTMESGVAIAMNISPAMKRVVESRN